MADKMCVCCDRMIAVVLAMALAACSQQDPANEAPAAVPAADPRPNILLVMADDLGYSDIGPFGGEISTPNLDALAERGISFTNFRVQMMCSPTRAMLLTGLNPHRVGYGTMAGEYTDATRGQPGYEARLDPGIDTLADQLRGAGYRTIVTGKWDMGGRGAPELRPDRRGFDESWVLIEGSASHFTKRAALEELPDVTYVTNGQEIDLPDDFYSSKDFADRLIDFVGESDEEPFFAFLSFSAPHYPLQAPDEDIEAYRGKYDEGYEPVRNARIERMREKGIFADDREPAERHPVWPAWDELSPAVRALETRRMEIYAGMVESMDYHLGRVLEHLGATGQLDTTIVLFLSDNGAEGGNPLDWGGQKWFDWMETSFDTRFENMGRRNSYVWTGPGWGYVSAAPFRYAKGFGTEGGLRSPLIMAGPGVDNQGRVSAANTHVLDLNATLRDIAGVSLPPRAANAGRSMLPILTDSAATVREPGDYFAVELLGRRALVQGDWKITWTNPPWGPDGEWVLFNLADDPGERYDRSLEQPEKKARLVALWDEWADANGVIPIDAYPMGIYNSFTHYQWLPPDMRDAAE